MGKNQYDKEHQSYYNKDTLPCMSRSDLPYMRKRITQLEHSCLAKDIRYKELKKKYRNIQNAYWRLLKALGCKYKYLEKYFLNVPYISIMDIKDKILAQGHEERIYYDTDNE